MPLLRTLLIDNYDSYTHNLFHLLALANPHSPPPLVLHNDSYPRLSDLLEAHGPFSAIVISPGPGHPDLLSDFPQLCRDAVLQSDIPVLGVCLGHQGIVSAFGGAVGVAKPVHGRVCRMVCLERGGLFEGLPKVVRVVRYHSLEAKVVGMGVRVIARACEVDEAVMAVKVNGRCCWGVQFHPESVSTGYGRRMAENFYRLIKAWRPEVGRGINMGNSGSAMGAEGRRNGKWNGLRRTGERKRGGELKVIWRRLDGVSVSSLELFRSLFCNDSNAWWLDSCMNDPVSSRFSFMGNASGPMSEIVTYNTSSSTVTIVNSRDAQSSSFQIRGGLVSWLKERLRRRFVAMAEVGAGLPFEFNCGYVGTIGYELKHETDNGTENSYESPLPDAALVFADRLLAVDHAKQGQVYLVATASALGDQDVSSYDWFNKMEAAIKLLDQEKSTVASGRGACQKSRSCLNNGIFSDVAKDKPERAKRIMSFRMDRSRKQYMNDVSTCLQHIRNGDSYEICLTNRIRASLPKNVSAFSIYEKLREINPAPYAAFLKIGSKLSICCSSPERFLKVQSNGWVESKPIKGTMRRGCNSAEDKELKEELATSVKNRSENLMIVDLVRNDLGRVCEVGSIDVPAFMKVESYSSVHQLVSTVRGRISEDYSVVDCFREAFPMGSMTGAPKTRTMEIIDKIERSSRGIFSGTIGYFSLCGAADLNVVIRTAVIHRNEICIGAGGAIVALSDPGEEFDEAVLKGKAIMHAIAQTVSGCDNYLLDTFGIEEVVIPPH